MSRGREAHHSRREELVAQAAMQRDEIARGVARWEKALNVVDRVSALLGHAKKAAPLFAMGLGAVTLVAARSVNVRQWIQGASGALRTARSVLGFVASLRR